MGIVALEVVRIADDENGRKSVRQLSYSKKKLRLSSGRRCERLHRRGKRDEEEITSACAAATLAPRRSRVSPLPC